MDTSAGIPEETGRINSVNFPDDTGRLRRLTPKGEEMFESNLMEYEEQYDNVWRSIELIIQNLDTGTLLPSELQDVSDRLTERFKLLMKHYNLMVIFLGRQKTDTANRLMTSYEKTFQRQSDIVYKIRNKVKEAILCIAEDYSERLETRSMITTATSSKMHLKAEIKKSELRFLDQETELKKQRAVADIELMALQQRKEHAAAEAEAICNEHEELPINFDNLSGVKQERTKQYVSSLRDKPPELSRTGLNVNAPVFQRQIPHIDTSPQSHVVNVAHDLSKYLLKKDLLMVGFSTFKDSPQHYEVWKAGFVNVVQEMDANPLEELDLLTKWLGPESKEFAISIRACNLNDPCKGLSLIWGRLEELYGRPEMKESALRKRLNDIPRITDSDRKQYYKLVDVLTEIDSAKQEPNYKTLLSYFDSSAGVLPIVAKLPRNIQEKWSTRASSYKLKNSVPFPPFSYFLKFVKEICMQKNDPSLNFSELSLNTESEMKQKHYKTKVNVRKTDIASNSNDMNSEHSSTKRCPIHKVNGHSIMSCRQFLAKTYQQKREYLKDNQLCLRCCVGNHFANKCHAFVKCLKCQSARHVTCMHYDNEDQKPSETGPMHGGENIEHSNEKSGDSQINAKCSELCGDSVGGRSCGKVVLVNAYPAGKPELAMRMYAVIDDQSNKTLARSHFFDSFEINSNTSVFTMSSCSGTHSYTGRTASNFIIEPVHGGSELLVPNIIECDEIPNNRQEIPTQNVAMAYPHMSDIVKHIPDIDPTSEILLLIGRDIPPAHYPIDHRFPPDGNEYEPFAQRLKLGWTIIGDVCMNGVHKPNIVNAMKTHILWNGRNSVCEPCDNHMLITKEKQNLDHAFTLHNITEPTLTGDIFMTTPQDEMPSYSTDDQNFLALMNSKMQRDINGNWMAPLPFRSDRNKLPDNRSQALKRAIILDQNLKKNPTKREHALEFMENIIKRGHAEIAPPLCQGEERWYLPIFGVYNAKKPGKIRMVFDSSATYQNTSLNRVLLSGPDLTNSLIGVLMRFRKEKVAVSADIEQMFHCFSVTDEHRNYLRFLWYQDNNINKPLVEYRMTVHVFGNSPSPAVATYGLRRAAMEAVPEFGDDILNFVEQNFYVDDGLVSLPTSEQAADLLLRAQQALKKHGNLRLHKIVSNHASVMQHFPSTDLSKDLVHLDLSSEDLPTQRSLGLVWNLQKDTFEFNCDSEEKSFTRRGVLSFINSLYDPLGFVAPIIVQGKLILRDMILDSSISWDDPLSDAFLTRWISWKQALSNLQDLYIPRQYIQCVDPMEHKVVIFTDASETAIAAVAYLTGKDQHENIHIGFLMGKAKVAPKQANSIPRLELCAAVLGIELARIISKQLTIPQENFSYYSDSMVVLGYLHNTTKRFLTYVSNRIYRVLAFSRSIQWNYVPTDINPADHGTRATPGYVMNDMWLNGPTQWLSEQTSTEAISTEPTCTYNLVNANDDKEIKIDITANKISTCKIGLDTERFERFSTWSSLVRSLMFLKRKCREISDYKTSQPEKVELYSGTELFIIKTLQSEVFGKEIACLEDKKNISKTSKLISLDPWIDENGILRVGGRLKHAKISFQEKSPIIIPGKHHVARLIVLHQHQLVRHQGRHFTEGAIRAAGFWITGCKRLVYSIISNCVKCRRTRGTLSVQKMCDLPTERISPSPPFTYVGLDCFGPWEVVTRRTRGGAANSKRWAVLFVCMSSRAVHIEVVEEMSTPSFINALRRFYSIRGKVKEFYSDRGTNFVGSIRELGIQAINVEDPKIETFLNSNDTIWNFNTPYSSHMGGAWERLIGVTRRILDSLLFDVRHTKLTHEVLTTFMCEVCAIINNRPITPVSSDPESPFILTPNILLTQKTGDVSEASLNMNITAMYTSQWKIVQAMADMFWNRWRNEYLQTLQLRKKWEGVTPNIKVDDIVLLKDNDVHRNQWPLGRISRVFLSKDALVRKVEVRTVIDGTIRNYVRPITQVVVLLSV